MDHAILEYNLTLRTVCIARLRKTGDAAGHKIGIWKRYVTRGCGTCMTVFVGQEMVNFPAPQKLDPKISPHGIHTVCDSVCGAGNRQFSCPTKTRPQDITPWYDSVCGAGNGQFSCPTKTRPQAPKSSQNRGIFDVYAKPKTTDVAKTCKNTAICDTFATQHVRNAVFYSVFGPPSQKRWNLPCFVKTHA